MKKNNFQGFSKKKIDLSKIRGGYYYSPTQMAGTNVDNDEEMITEPSDNDPDCSPNYNCQDGFWEDCTPGIALPGGGSGTANPSGVRNT